MHGCVCVCVCVCELNPGWAVVANRAHTEPCWCLRATAPVTSPPASPKQQLSGGRGNSCQTPSPPPHLAPRPTSPKWWDAPSQWAPGTWPPLLPLLLSIAGPRSEASLIRSKTALVAATHCLYFQPNISVKVNKASLLKILLHDDSVDPPSLPLVLHAD